jgi:hypothetical protein
MVALMLLAVAGLALSGSGAVMLRELMRARESESAALAVSSRLGKLRSSRCGSLASGSAMHAGLVRELWTVELLAADRLRVLIELQLPRAGRTEHFESESGCVP